ncbi:MAG TPA: helix-turn-helix domain-containing protein [Acidimicrobiia bacterium]|nr:helix-turn-helix domain-containing protein [Acidimicrobiia bacterium]
MVSLKGDGEVERLPVLLTVEEAGALLRVGRTKAYAMAREWRETDGRSGLPVIELGHALRVPRRALEEMVGAELRAVELIESQPTGDSRPRGKAKQSRQIRTSGQLDLFGTTED